MAVSRQRFSYRFPHGFCILQERLPQNLAPKLAPDQFKQFFFLSHNLLLPSIFSKGLALVGLAIPDFPISRPLNAENSVEFSLRIQLSRAGKRDFGYRSSAVPSEAHGKSTRSLRSAFLSEKTGFWDWWAIVHIARFTCIVIRWSILIFFPLFRHLCLYRIFKILSSSRLPLNYFHIMYLLYK